MENQKEKYARRQPVCLTIAGLDPSGGAGIVADVKTFSAFGCFAASAVTSITFQNTQGVFGAESQSAETVRNQILPILDDFEIAALKTGMLPTREIIEEVANITSEKRLGNFVADPVVRSTSGFDLIDDAALEALIEKLFPLSVIVTPNIPEAERITKMKIESASDIRRAAKLMRGYGAKNVLIKGGHLPFGISERLTENVSGREQNPKTEDRKAIDFLFLGDEEITFSAEFVETTATHGTGCTLAAAIAANLAKGKNLLQAVETAKKFVTEAIQTSPRLGKGHSPINQLLENYK